MSSPIENTENTYECAINGYMSMWEGKHRKQKHKTSALNLARHKHPPTIKKKEKRETTDIHEKGMPKEGLWEVFAVSTTPQFKPKTSAEHDQLSVINQSLVLSSHPGAP